MGYRFNCTLMQTAGGATYVSFMFLDRTVPVPSK